jgi:hypothetical protein
MEGHGFLFYLQFGRNELFPILIFVGGRGLVRFRAVICQSQLTGFWSSGQEEFLSAMLGDVALGFR